MQPTPIVALIYDFDKTLSAQGHAGFDFLPGSASTERVWRTAAPSRSKPRGRRAGLMYMMRAAAERAGRPYAAGAGGAGRQRGVLPPAWRAGERVNRIGEATGVKVEHYLISSGLKEIIDGSRIAGRFKAVFAASYVSTARAAPSGRHRRQLYRPDQYLFRINKGISTDNDHDLNAPRRST